MARIFISHSSLDREQSTRLLAWLHHQGFVSTFLDFDGRAGIAAGADWERTLYRELSSADAVLLILTKNWFESKWCFVEFAQARALGKAIFPLIETPTGETLVSSDIQHLNLTLDREGGLERLQTELTAIALNTRGGFPWEPSRPPYPGLLAFEEADAAIYFGRDDDVRRLIERLNARRAQGVERLVAVLGASGSGKSSLLRAGVVPRLKRDPHHWIVLPPFRPQLDPLTELAQVVATGLGAPSDWRQWRKVLESDDLRSVLAELARDLRARHGENEAQVLLVIDQGEELFSSPDAEKTERFFEVLNAMLDDRLPFLAAMSLRSDYLGRLQQAPRLAAAFEQFSLKPMPLERVRDIIEGPAKVAGIVVEEGLVATAMADARTEDALPLLAFALRELYDRSTGSARGGLGARLTADAYGALGDAAAQLSPLENAVRRKADEVLGAAKPAPEDLQALKESFIPAMVRVNPAGEYVRRPATLAALPPRAQPLLERLAKARLLTILEERGRTMVEVTHEALLRKWPLLRGWLDEEREFLIGKDQLEQDLRDWEAAAPGQKTEALLTGLKLTRARGWLLAKPHQLSEAERNFVQASIAQQEAAAAQRERARRRILRSAIAAAGVFAVLTSAALWEWRQASLQESRAVSRQLAAQANQDFATDLGAAFRDAVSAAQTAHTLEAEIALHIALANPRERYMLHHHDLVSSAVFSPDGKRIVTASYDKTARVWDAVDGHLLVILAGHADQVNSAVFSPDGQHIVTASNDRTARVWNAADGRLLVTLGGHAQAVNSAAFSPDGQKIVTASSDKTARLWSAADGRCVAILTGHTDEVTSAVFSAQSNRIVTASDDTTARLWDGEDGRLLATLAGHAKEVNSAAFSPDGTHIVTASSDKTARLWSAADGRYLVSLTGHTEAVWTAAFSPDSRHVVTAGWDNTARLWSAADGALRKTLTGHTDPVLSAMFSPDGRRVVTSGKDKTARLWDAVEGRPLGTLNGHTEAVWTAVFSPDGRQIVTASRDTTARLWDAADGQLEASLMGHTEALRSSVFSPDGKRIVTASHDNTARIWDAKSGKLLETLTGHTEAVTSAVFSPDGRHVVTASWDNTARVWDAFGGRLLETLTGHKDIVISALFSPDGKRIVTASGDNTARVWNATNGELLETLSGHSNSVTSAVFSPDGSRIATASSDMTGRVWDAANGHLLLTLKGHPTSVRSAAFSPDGRRIVTTTGDAAWIWDATDGRLLLKLTGHTEFVYSAIFSPDGKRILTASRDKTARIWDAASGQLLSTLAGHGDAIESAVFSPDGKRIVTASDDQTARVWDAADGRLLATLTGHTDKVASAVFSPDGKRIVTASDDHTANVYLIDFDELLKRAKQLLPIDRGN